MKRTELKRKTPLARTTSLRSTPASPGRSGAKTDDPSSQPTRVLERRRKRRKREPGEAAWQRKRSGHCCLCGTYGRLVLHHVVTEAKIRWHATPEQITAGICWDQRNAMRVGAPMMMGGRCNCHDGHHNPGVNNTRIPISRVPDAALSFATELMGKARAEDYFQTYYQSN